MKVLVIEGGKEFCHNDRNEWFDGLKARLGIAIEIIYDCHVTREKTILNSDDYKNAMVLQGFGEVTPALLDHFVDVSGFALVILHTSNAWAKAFFEHRCGSVPFVCYSGEPGASWFAGAKKVRREARCYSWDEVVSHLEEFLKELAATRPEVPPWHIFEGRRVKQAFCAALLPLDILIQGAMLPQGNAAAKKAAGRWWDEARDGLRDLPVPTPWTVEDWLRSSLPGLAPDQIEVKAFLVPYGKPETTLCQLIRKLQGDGKATLDEISLLSDDKELEKCHETYKNILKKLCV